MDSHLAKRQFTVAEHRQMAEAGILAEDDRIGLIEGEIVYMTAIGRQHPSCVARLTRLLGRLTGEAAIVSVQNPVDVGEYSEPQPDFAILRNQPDYYDAGHPNADDVLLLVEVCGTSVESDRRFNVPRYYRSGIPEVWLVDVDQKTITVYYDPASTGYRSLRVARQGEHICPRVFPDLKIAVTKILADLHPPESYASSTLRATAPPPPRQRAARPRRRPRSRRA